MSDQNSETASVRDSNKYYPKIKKKISNYNKKQMLKMLKKANCNPKELDAMVTRFRVDDDDLIKSKKLKSIFFFSHQLLFF